MLEISCAHIQPGFIIFSSSISERKAARISIAALMHLWFYKREKDSTKKYDMTILLVHRTMTRVIIHEGDPYERRGSVFSVMLYRPAVHYPTGA